MDRRALTNIGIIFLLIAVMVGLNLLFYVDKREQDETEDLNERTTYSGRTYGLLAYYTLLEENGYPVGRWRRPYADLANQPEVRTLFIIGVAGLNTEELTALKTWVSEGGTAVVVSRQTEVTFNNHSISTTAPVRPGGDLSATPWQPVPYVAGVGRLALSDRARSLTWRDTAQPVAGNIPAAPVDELAEDDAEAASTEDETPVEPRIGGDTTGFVPYAGIDGSAVFGEVLYGKGRVLFVSDEYILANNGIGQGDNALFGLNLAACTRSGAEGVTSERPTIFFDEYHHNYRDGSAGYGDLSDYFRGTPVPWIVGQLALLTGLALYSSGRRFARPLPRQRADRGSNLEYVSAMAQIQLTAESYDLAIENIYVRFRRLACRYAGQPTTVKLDHLATVAANRAKREPAQLLTLLRRCEEIINGKATTAAEMVRLAAAMREWERIFALKG